MSSARILIAEDNKVLPYIRHALVGYELLVATSLKEADRFVAESAIDLFILGVHFDDSRGTELASNIRRSAAHAQTPIILLRCLPSTIAKFIRSSTNALKASGTITEFLELENVEQISDELRKAVESHLPAEKLSAGSV